MHGVTVHDIQVKANPMPVLSGLRNHRDNRGLIRSQDAVSVELPRSMRPALSGNMSHFEMRPFILRELIAGGLLFSDACLDERGKTCARVIGTAFALL